MTIFLEDLLDIVTYNKLFNYADLPCHIASLCSIEDPLKQICYVEPFNHEVSRVWYPTENWIAEQKRRTELQRTVSAKETHHIEISLSGAELQKKLYKAIMSGNTEEVSRLNKMIQ